MEYGEEGVGVPVLVLHGTPGGFDAGLAAGRILGGDFRWIAVSRAGYLRTAAPRGLSAVALLKQQADQIANVLDELKIESVPVLAFSGGGPSGLAFALRHADRCTGLALISAETRPHAESRVTHCLRRVGEEALVASDLVNWIPGLVAPRSGLAYLLRSLTPVYPRREGMILDGDIFATFPPFPFENIACPVLLAHGTDDCVVPFRDSEAAWQRLPQAELHAIKRGNHLSALLPRSTVARRIRDFLGSPASD